MYPIEKGTKNEIIFTQNTMHLLQMIISWLSQMVMIMIQSKFLKNTKFSNVNSNTQKYVCTSQ